MSKRSRRSKYIRAATFPVEEVLPYVFTKQKRHELRQKGISYRSPEWIEASRKVYTAVIDGELRGVTVPMGSHRYQLYAEKGTTCVRCGIKGTYFALERGRGDNPNRYHFNLYGRNKHGHEVMITKDHITPRSKGGKNKLSNYQPMCYKCNQRKADKVEHG